jgi:lipopolysaccharide transport system permease protein
MKKFLRSPAAMVRSLWTSRDLLYQLTERDVVGRYRGSFIGVVWSLVTPLILLAIYTLVFSGVFKARWGVERESTSDFALVLFSGLMVFNIFGESVARAPQILAAHTNYVKRIVFPLEILPAVVIGSALFHFCTSFLIWCVAHLLLRGLPPPTIFLLPGIIAPLLLLTLGIAWFFASLGIYVRDLQQIASLVVSALLFGSPVFYPLSSLPPRFQTIMAFNPLAMVVEQTRGVMLWGTVPSLAEYLGLLSFALLVSACGFAWFQLTRRGFADVV